MKIYIDPDCDRSGIAIVKGMSDLTILNLALFDLFDYLNKYYIMIDCVYIEASWLISNNWTSKGKVNERGKAKIDNGVGKNHAYGEVIEKMCKYLELNYKLVKPLKKAWKGSNGKITHVELISLLKGKFNHNITRTNQESRDAVLLAIANN